MAELLSLFQFSPYDTKGLGHGWEELQVAGAYVVQQKKKMTGLNKLFRSFRRERAFRIIVNAPPNYPCVAAAELREEISRALEWLTKNVPAQDERRDRHQVDKLMKRFTKQLSRVEVPVPGTNGVPLHKLPTPELQKLQTSLSLANPNDKVLPAIWRELTQRELAQCEERWQQREEEKVPVKIVFDSTVVAEMELPVSMTGGELFAMLQAKKLLPEGATCPRLGSPSNRLDTLAKVIGVVLSLFFPFLTRRLYRARSSCLWCRLLSPVSARRALLRFADHRSRRRPRRLVRVARFPSGLSLCLSRLLLRPPRRRDRSLLIICRFRFRRKCLRKFRRRSFRKLPRSRRPLL